MLLIGNVLVAVLLALPTVYLGYVHIVGKAECESLCFSGGSYTNEDVDWAGL